MRRVEQVAKPYVALALEGENIIPSGIFGSGEGQDLKRFFALGVYRI